MLTFLTDFGDQAVILPLLLIVAAVLAWHRRWRLLVLWGLAVPAVLGTVLVLKTMCYACLWRTPWLGPDGWGLRSPSGHTASATVVFGCLAVLLLWRSAVLPLGALAALAVAAAIGTSRVMLGAHTPADVTVATTVGLAGVLAFGLLRAFTGPRWAEPVPRGPIVLSVLVVLLVFHGLHLSAEEVIADSARGWWRRLIVTACLPTVG